jgi:hypothetical protein|nr:MAG TPA: hypothetical protein [Caudoviricetes sp.]
MKMKDAIKLGIGLCIGKKIVDVFGEVCEPEFFKVLGKIQDACLDWSNDFDRKLLMRKFYGGGELYFGTKYKKSTITNKKNPIGFV